MGLISATITAPRIWNSRMFGPGTYDVPEEAKDYLEGTTDVPPVPTTVVPPAPWDHASGGGGAGTTWHINSDFPDNSVGVDGDFFLITGDGNIYRKAEGAYGLVGNASEAGVGLLTNSAAVDVIPVTDSGGNLVASPIEKLGDSIRIVFFATESHGNVALIIDADNENISITAPSGLIINGQTAATGTLLSLDGFPDSAILRVQGELFALSKIFDDGTNVMINSLPTVDPVVTNALWNDAGTLKISTG